MLHFRELDWLLVPGASRLTAWIRPKDRTHEDIDWELSLHYVAGGAKWRRVQSFHRPRASLAVLNFKPRVRRWTELARASFWEIAPMEEAFPDSGVLDVEYSPGAEPERERSFLNDHIWRVAGRDGRFLTVELAAFADGRNFLKEMLGMEVTPDGREERAERDAEFWKENAQLYLIENVPFGMVTVQVPRNAPDTEAYALGRARTLLGLEMPEHMEVSDFTHSAKAHESIRGDLYVHMHFNGHYED